MEIQCSDAFHFAFNTFDSYGSSEAVWRSLAVQGFAGLLPPKLRGLNGLVITPPGSTAVPATFSVPSRAGCETWWFLSERQPSNITSYVFAPGSDFTDGTAFDLRSNTFVSVERGWSRSESTDMLSFTLNVASGAGDRVGPPIFNPASPSDMAGLAAGCTLYARRLVTALGLAGWAEWTSIPLSSVWTG